MTLAAWLPLLAICLAGAMSPGPSLAVVLRETARGGTWAGMACALAHAGGVGLYAAATVAGLSVVLRTPLVAHALQAGGAIYLLWLAQGAWRNAGRAPLPAGGNPHRASWRAAASGLLIAVLNPKLALFMLALFSQFMPPEATTGTLLILVGTAVLCDALWYCAVAVLAGRSGHSALQARHGELIERVFALLLAGLGVFLLGRLLLSVV